MDDRNNPVIKSAVEIGALVRKLNPRNQTYVLNTIDLLLFRQNREREGSDRKNSSGD